MDNTIIGIIISVVGSIVVASLTFYLTKRHELNVKWQKEKLESYKFLLTAISDLAVDGTDKEDANMRFSFSANTLVLSASPEVIKALMEFHKIVISEEGAKHEKEYLITLVRAIRKDIGLAKGGDSQIDSFHLIGSKPKNPPINNKRKTNPY